MNDKAKWAIGIVVILAIIWLGFQFFNDSQTPATGEPIKLGVIAGTTGEYASAGEGYLNGFLLALEKWNAEESLKFEAIVEDDGFDARKGVSAYSKLKNADRVDAYAVLSTFTIDAIMDDVLEEEKPVALGFEQTQPAQDDNIFQVLPVARPVMVELGRHIKNLGYENPFVFVSINSPVYTRFASGFVEGYGRNVNEERVTGDTTAIRTLVAKLKAANPDAVAFFAAPQDGALITREILQQFQSTAPKLIYDQSIQSGLEDYKEILGDELEKLDGSIVALSRNEFTDTFKRSYRDKYEAEAPFASDMGYNSFMLLAQTHDPDSEAWIAAMKNLSFIGADGEVKFDEVGLRIPNAYFAEFRGGNVIFE